MSSHRICRLPSAVAVAAVLLTLPAQAVSGPARVATKSTKPKTSAAMKKAIWGPVALNGKSAFPIYRDLGAKIFMYQLPWSSVAPTKPADPANPADPAYRWPAVLGTAASAATRNNMELFVRVTGAPKWANGDHPPAWVPSDPQDLATFMATASKRYPSVKYWDVWEETTRSGSFQPLAKETKRGAALNAEQAQAPHTYARMLDRAYGAIKAVDPTDLVVGGNTFTAGDISPRNFIANLRLPDGRPPRMDLFAHNPFSGRKPQRSKPPLAGGFADISDVDTLEGWIDKSLQRKGAKKIPIFLTEWALPTDHSNYLFNFFVSRATQASWTTAALRLARSDKRIMGLAWYTLSDEPRNVMGDEARFGLLDSTGHRKPSYAAFRAG